MTIESRYEQLKDVTIRIILEIGETHCLAILQVRPSFSENVRQAFSEYLVYGQYEQLDLYQTHLRVFFQTNLPTVGITWTHPPYRQLH